MPEIVALRERCPAVTRLSGVAPTFASRRLTVDVGLLPLRAGPQTLSPFVRAAQPLTFALRGRALAFVRALLSVVGRPFAVVCNLVALVSDPISSARLEFASPEVGLVVGERFFPLIERASLPFQPSERFGAVLGGHSSP